MAAKQYDLESSVLDWYRDFCPENSFDVQIRPDITFADVVVGMANGIDLSDLIGSDSEVFSNIVFVKLAEITGESYRTVANVWYEAPMNSDWVDEEERRLIDAAKRVVESKFEPISIGDINSPKAFDIANHAMLNEIMPSCSPIEYGIAELILPRLNWGSDSVATDAISKKHFNFKSSIRDWYIRAFPSDQLGYRINPLATFAGAVKCMADGGDIYKYLGVGDSPVRENVFFKIAAITGVDYDAVYDLWLHHDEDECSRLVFLGDHPDCAVDRDWREQFDEVVSPSEQVRYDELLAAEEHRKAETFDSFMEVNETPMDEVRGAGIAMMLMQGIVFAEIAKKIDGPSEELNERIATFNRDLKRLYNEPLHKKVEQIESQVGKLEEKAAIYDEMRYTAEHTDPADIRIAEGSASMTGALMAAAMASYDLSCGLIDDEHIGRYGDVITALEERMGVGTGALSVQTEAGELIANAKEDGISVGINIPGGKCADIAFVDADPDANDLYPTPVRAFTYNGRDEEPDHRTDVHLDGDMVLEGQLTAEAPAHLPGDVAAAAKEAAAKSVKPDTVGADGIKH